MPAVFDFMKLEKEYYTAKPEPEEIQVPPMKFMMTQGMGAPGGAAYTRGVETITALARIIRGSKNGEHHIKGYFDYRMPPLECFFWGNIGRKDLHIPRKKWLWCCMYRQPEFVQDEDFEWAREECRRKKPDLDVSRVRFWTYKEGRCVQMMLTGPRTHQTAAIKKMKAYMVERRMSEGRYPIRKHHEIYLNDAVRTDPDNLKTILRLPVAFRF
jgi:hypothetical protein